MTPRIPAVTFFVLVAALVACNGPASAPPTAFSPAAPQAGHTRLHPSHTIGGVIHTSSFEVSGDTRVTKDLIVFADHEVTIKGKLEVPEGIQVAFFTPVFNFGDPKEASINEIVADDNPAHPRAVNDIVSAGHIFFYFYNRGWTVGSGDNLELSGTAGEPSIAYLGQITLEQGWTGGEWGSLPSGQNGGSIEIGTAKAIADAEALARMHGDKDLKASAFDHIYLEAPELGIANLQAGNGGAGQDGPTGTVVGGVYNIAAHDGGNGGSINVVAKEITGARAGLYAGSGGYGGAIGLEVPGYKSPMNGTAASPDAMRAAIFMGAGGNGGSVSVAAKKPNTLVLEAGNGGWASLITNNMAYANYETFWAGTGFSSPAPGALKMGNGGDVNLYLALPGNHGSGTNANAPARTNGQYYPVAFLGGDACGCLPYGYFPGVPAGQEIQGANGGSLKIVLPANATPSELVKTYGLSITVQNFGDGGNSFMTLDSTGHCPSPPPAGLNGGNGGTLHDNGLWPLMFPPGSNFGSGFAGGAGAPGRPGGWTGANGKDDEGQQIGGATPIQSTLCN